MKGTPLKKTTTPTLVATTSAALPRATIQTATASRALSTLLLAVTALWALPAAGANLFVVNAQVEGSGTTVIPYGSLK
jgi:hypothetical protein